MTEDEFLKLIKSKSAKTVLDRLAKMPAKDRRAFAKPAMLLFKTLDRLFLQSMPDGPHVRDGEAVTIALLATATASELKRLSFFPLPGKIEITDIVATLKPDWTQAVVDHFVEQRTFYVNRFKPLWEAGLCQRPQSDAIILSYYSRWGRYHGIEEERLLSGDVWRFFEVEGGGEDSLANHDKFLKRGQESWADRLKAYSDAGKLDRQRLLDASLDALERDFAQYRAGWYSRFHVLMAPTAAEMAARSGRYLRLLASSIPPTVSFALKRAQALDKVGAIDPGEMLAALEPALQARAKGTVTGALKLLLSAAKREPELRAAAAEKAVLALISEDAGVQGKALDTVEALGAEAVSGDLAAYVDLVAPSVRSRIAELAGVSVEQVAEDTPAFERAVANRVLPVASAEEALAAFLTVLEDPRDPIEVERAMDGLSRFGAALRADETVLSPLKKRAKQVCRNPGESDLRYVLALTGRGFCEGALEPILAEESGNQSEFVFFPEFGLQEFHLARNAALLKRVMDGAALPLLSLPSETSGLVHVADLLERMSLYRKAGVAPDTNDLSLALMRLASEHRSDSDLPTGTEADRAVAYAMGAKVAVGPTPELWAAAWRARVPEEADKAVADLFSKPTPDCGVPAIMTLEVKREKAPSSDFSWLDVEVPVIPLNQIRSRALPALFGLSNARYADAFCCGNSFADIAWASMARPADPEPFFRIGLIDQDTWQKLADNRTRAYLEPFFRPGPEVGPLGAGVLAYYMACEDKSVSSLAVEAAVHVAESGRLSQELFAQALRLFIATQTLPLSRWTKGLKAMADLGAAGFVRQVIVALLDFEPDDTPKDIGGLLELCYELHVAQATRLERPEAIACLASIPGGGKVARFSKKLLEMTAP